MALDKVSLLDMVVAHYSNLYIPTLPNNVSTLQSVVGVADGGLDTDNCYLRDSSSSDLIYGGVANGWDFSQRKVVHYDDTFGDRTEESMGHGTLVGGIVAGRKSTDGINEEAGHADGTAPGSRLAFFDMEEATYGIGDPGVERLLKSLYNPAVGTGNNKGARVINASWGRSYYGQYTSFCRQYDAALRNDYPDLLFVVSAGNTARLGANSIQDPASCKNPLAVGSSLGYGTDSIYGEKGIEYLADYSSRGPTQDNRMKPDIVAPGHFVLAVGADPGMVGECDGNSAPDVNDGTSAGDSGVKYTTGTSMAAPALAGGAAILRQYFEEAYCNPSICCGSKGCAESFNPSGTLIKAVLMNGAQPLTGGVQYVPNGDILYDQPLQPYDSNQGMGRMNLINSVPLAGKNNMQMKVVNNKHIVNGYKDIITLLIDKSDSTCERKLSVTLAWYDAPASTGCKSCVVNDLDLFIRTSSGVVYPNGRNSKDSQNTVERIQISPSDGEEVRIVVEATNFATYGEKYSLAITGCFRFKGTSTVAPIVQQEWPVDDIAEYSASSIERSLCPSDRFFEVGLNTLNDGQYLAWTLIQSLSDGGVESIMHGPSGSSGYENNKEYHFSACLEPSTRYRFQLRNTLGDAIESWYKLTYNGLDIFNSQWASKDQMGRVSTFRFETNQSGMYQQLASNTFAPHVELSESTEIGSKGDENSYDGSRHMRRSR
jgi:subtilisin family serine protease